MVVLRAIGGFFAKIGRWIRDTAWIQPLLIVGGIFAVIFSIPYITSWVSSWFSSGSASNSYYDGKSLSWSDIDEQKSEIDNLFQYVSNFETEKGNASKAYKKYGEKFFVAFVQEDCTGCESNYYGFKTLQSDWKNYTTTEEFKLFTIFIDEENEDDKVETNYFKKYIVGDYNTDHYNEVFEAFSTLETNYTVLNSIDVEAKFNEFTSPTTFLFDFTENAPKGGNYNGDALDFGLSEIFFDVTGDSNNKKAKFIWECWNHSGAFSADPDNE